MCNQLQQKIEQKHSLLPCHKVLNSGIAFNFIFVIFFYILGRISYMSKKLMSFSAHSLYPANPATPPTPCSLIYGLFFKCCSYTFVCIYKYNLMSWFMVIQMSLFRDDHLGLYNTSWACPWKRLTPLFLQPLIAGSSTSKLDLVRFLLFTIACQLMLPL